MASINFYLGRGDNKDLHPIFLVYQSNGKKFKTYTQEKVLAKYWDAKKQCVKSISEADVINDELVKQRNKLKAVERQLKESDEPFDINDVKELFLQTEGAKESKMGLLAYFDHFIALKKASRQRKTLSEYITIVNDFKEYEEFYKDKLSFKKINDVFFSRYLDYLATQKGNGVNTIAKKLTTLKTMLHGATKNGLNTNLAYQDFKVEKIETDKEYLTKDELLKFNQFDFSNNERLSKARDLFCFGCFTGLRFSDVSTLKEEVIVEQLNKDGEKYKALNFKMVKTKTTAFVPLNAPALAIIDKYQNTKKDKRKSESGTMLFPRISNQKLNDYIKEALKVAGIDTPSIVTKFIGTKRTDTVVDKYELLSTHSARRTFAVLSLEQGMRIEVLQKILGHRSIKTTMQYVRILDDIKQQEMSGAWAGFGK